MDRYLITIYWNIDGSIEFDILETDKEEGSEEFEELIEKYEHNQNTVLVTKLNDDVLNELRKLNEKINEIILKKPIN